MLSLLSPRIILQLANRHLNPLQFTEIVDEATLKLINISGLMKLKRDQFHFSLPDKEVKVEVHRIF